jgi:hypothetical protein
MPKSTPEPVQTPEGGQVQNPASSGESAPTVPASGQPARQSTSQSDSGAKGSGIEVESDPSQWTPPADPSSIPDLPESKDTDVSNDKAAATYHPNTGPQDQSDSEDKGSVLDPQTQAKAEKAAGAPKHESPKDAQQ